MDHPEIPYNFSQPFAYMFSEQKMNHDFLPGPSSLGATWFRLKGGQNSPSQIGLKDGTAKGRCWQGFLNFGLRLGGTCLWSQSRSTLLAVRVGLSRGKGLRVRGNWAPTIQL